MPLTPDYLLPYPDLQAAPDVPRDVKALADATVVALHSVSDAVHMRNRNGGPQTIGDGVTQNLSMTTVLERSGGMDSDGIDFIIPSPGVYAVRYNLIFSGGSAGGTFRYRGFWLKNGQLADGGYTLAAGLATIEPDPGFGGAASISQDFALTTGDKVRLQFQPLGLAVTLPVATGVSASITRIGRL